MKPAESAQIEFIKDLLRKGLERKDILPKFTETYHKSEKTFNTRLKIATEAIRGESAKIVEASEAYINKEVEARNMSILTALERKEILSQIARGEIKLQKPFVVAGGNGIGSSIETIEVVPDWMDRKNAIAELNKMDGSYAATKTNVSINKAGLDAITDTYE